MNMTDSKTDGQTLHDGTGRAYAQYHVAKTNSILATKTYLTVCGHQIKTA